MKRDVSFAPRRQTLSPLIGGFLGLSYPTILVVSALSVGFRRGGDMGAFAATIAASVMFLIASPTAWVLSFSFIDVTRFTVLVFGIATSFPIWYLLGTALARTAMEWLTWMRRYVVISVSWTALNLLVLAVMASLAS
ncbi:MAG: hypothetical protein BMS9Abin20_0571 [Acidimicrobiia bacterium]|nr:MAG: hypothetical protein BMS9Abin20_0571 [Acidimicrobiia bacterium]